MAGQQLDREESIEQAHFFRVYRERLQENIPSQEILQQLQDEILSTTRLPLALEFLRGEMLQHGQMSQGMERLPHYFTEFQAFVMARAEEERSKFDQRVALQVLERESEYLSGTPQPPALFVFQFECVARNRLGYDRGMRAIAAHPLYSEDWKQWILRLRYRLGTTEFSDLIYLSSEYHTAEHRRRTGDVDWTPPGPVLFGLQEGRIARASRGKDPLYMFAALQRQLGYPAVPRAKRESENPPIHPALEQRLQRLEQRLKLLEMEQKNEVDLSPFYKFPEVGAPPEPPDLQEESP